MIDRLSPHTWNHMASSAGTCPAPGSAQQSAPGDTGGDSVELSRPGIPLPEGKERMAKKAAIHLLLGDGIGPQERQVIEGALSGYSVENLTLLAGKGVKIHVKDIEDMPRQYGVRDFFAEAHDKALNGFLRYLVSLGAADEAGCAALQSPGDKQAFIEKAVKAHQLQVGFDAPDFGKGLWIDAASTEDLARVTSAPAVCAAHGGEGGKPDYLEIFVVTHNLSGPVIIHEVGHALDTLKSPDESRETDPVKLSFMRSVSPEVPGGSLRNSDLQRHYRQFVKSCSSSPEKIWSTYALSSGQVREYMAEAIRVCVTDPGRLREADRELYEFTSALLESPSYPSYVFSNR